MHFHLLFIIIIFFTFLTIAFSFSITVHNKTIAFEGQTLPYFETPATVIDSKEDDASDESDDFRPHEEDDDLNRGAINIRPGNKELIDSVPSLKKGSIDEDRGRPDDSISFISKAFTSRKTFSCPKTKTDFVTGNNLAMLNPEDIRIIAAMGDTVATGAGLWPLASIEFRGAAFPIGGDASIDGLVTIPNILREFIERQLLGVSHGMGSRDELPHYQLNVAESGAKTKDLPSQAEELVRRLNKMKEYNIREKWIMIIFTIGTEELCDHCAVPHLPAIKDALDILNRGIHKAFVVIVGPLHVSLASQQTQNLLQHKCNCTKTKTDNYVHQLFDAWENGLSEVQEHAIDTKRDTFGVLVLPFLTITSRYPSSLFVGNTTLLNRRGHNYAAKWLWNRLVGGPKYNLSTAILSKDKYFCPSVGCPYFRTNENLKYCPILRHVDATPEKIEVVKTGKKPRKSQRTLYLTALIVVGSASVTATLGCTIFYILSKKQTHGRFDMLPVPEDGEYQKPRTNTVATIKKENDSEKHMLEESDAEYDTEDEKFFDGFRDGGSQVLHKLS